MIKLIISDLDGTLFYDGKDLSAGITDENLAEIIRWQDQGIKFMCASGRSVERRIALHNLYGELWDFIGDNGGSIVLNDELIYHETVDRELVTEFYHLMKEHEGELMYNFSILGNYRVSSRLSNLEAIRVGPLERDDKKVCTISEYIEMGVPIQPTRIFTVVDDASKTQDFAKMIREHFVGKLDCAISGPHYIETVMKGENKGKAILLVAEKLGLSLDEIAVIGDNENDLPMIELVPNSFAMSHSKEEVKAKAKYVVEAVHEMSKYLNI